MKLQEHVLPLPTEPQESRRQPLPAGVRAIGKIVPEILNRYGLSLDDSEDFQPRPRTPAFVRIQPHTHAVLEPIAAGSVLA
jgi:hypothetical protein